MRIISGPTRSTDVVQIKKKQKQKTLTSIAFILFCSFLGQSDPPDDITEMTVTFYLNDELTQGTSVYQQDEGMKYNVRIQPLPQKN